MQWNKCDMVFVFSDVWYEMLVSRQSSTLSTSSKETITTSTAHTATMFILAALNKILADKYGQEARRVIKWLIPANNSGTPRSHTMHSSGRPARRLSRRSRRWSAQITPLKVIRRLLMMIVMSDDITGDNVSISSSVLPDPFQDACRLDADKYFLPFRWQADMIHRLITLIAQWWLMLVCDTWPR